MSKRRVIAVIGTRGFPGVQGGVERHCEALYPRLRPLLGDDDVLRVYRRRPFLTDACRDARYDGIEFVDLPSGRVKGVEALLHTLLAVVHLAFHRPAAVLVHNMGPGVFAPLVRLLGIPVVMTYHSVNYEHKKWNRVARALLRVCERVSLGAASRVIFVNRFRMEQMPERVLRKAVYIPNGVEPAVRVDEAPVFTRCGIMPDRYVLAVGRLTAEKGFEYLVEAATRCEAVDRLVIAGGSDHDDAYLHRLQALDTAGKTVFTGMVDGDDLHALYSRARLFALPSLSEGFPLALLEAMSYGLPVVASDIPACRLADLPDDAYVAPADADALRQALERFLAAPRASRSYDLTQYDWARIARQTAEQIIPYLHTL